MTDILQKEWRFVHVAPFSLRSADSCITSEIVLNTQGKTDKRRNRMSNEPSVTNVLRDLTVRQDRLVKRAKLVIQKKQKNRVSREDASQMFITCLIVICVTTGGTVYCAIFTQLFFCTGLMIVAVISLMGLIVAVDSDSMLTALDGQFDAQIDLLRRHYADFGFLKAQAEREMKAAENLPLGRHIEDDSDIVDEFDSRIHLP